MYDPRRHPNLNKSRANQALTLELKNTQGDKKGNRPPVAVCSLVIFMPHYFDKKGVIEHHFAATASISALCPLPLA